MRIHELAKEIGVDNKVIVEFLQKSGEDVKNHMSTCSADMQDKVRARFAKGAGMKNKGVQALKRNGIRVVAVPDFIAKEEPKTVPTRTADGEKIEDGGKQIAKIEAKSCFGKAGDR